MILNAVNIKRFFKKQFGIPVRVSKVPVKHPFFQVWIENAEKDHRKPLRYEHEFPVEMGQKLLDFIYGPGTPFPAGNVQLHRLSFDEREWEHLLSHYPQV
jgi:hypothetical protein